MSAAGDLSAAAQHLPDVERRRCRSILEAGFLSLIPSRPCLPSDQKNGDSALDAPRFAGRKERPFRHVARVLERGLHFAGGLGELPRKFLNLRWRIPQNLMIFFNCQRNFGYPNIFCSWRKCQTSYKRHSQRRSSMKCTFENRHLHNYCLG